MALATYKQRFAPLIDETIDKPDNPLDPLCSVYAGIGGDGLPYVWQDVGLGYHWDSMTDEQECYWAQIWDCKKEKTFYTKAVAGNKIVDSWFWGSDINLIIIGNAILQKGTGLQFSKDKNSDTLNFLTGTVIAPDTNCLIIRN